MGYNKAFQAVPAMGFKRASHSLDKLHRNSTRTSTTTRDVVGMVPSSEIGEVCETLRQMKVEQDLLPVSLNDSVRSMNKKGYNVCFSDEVDILEIPTLKELSFVEFYSIYMSQRDFDRIEFDIAMLIVKTKNADRMGGSSFSDDDEQEEEKEKENQDVSLLHAVTGSDGGGDNHNHDDDDVDDDSLRGLEMWLNPSRQEAAGFVIQETLKYQLCGQPDLMAALYRNNATLSLHAAYMIALNDEQQARREVLRT